MTDVLIKRELLERLACEVIPKTHQEMLDASEDFGAAIKELRAILAAPRQPEGDGLEELRSWDGSFAICNLSDARRTIAELRGLVPEPPPRPPEGEGMPRYGLRWNGPKQPVSVPMADGYWTPWHLAEAECEQLRANHRAPAGSLGDYALRQQRDRLAGLLRKARWYVAAARYGDNDEGDFAVRRQADTLTEIDASLAEVKS